MQLLHFTTCLIQKIITSLIITLFFVGPTLSQDKWCYNRWDGDIGPFESFYMDELCGDTIIDGLEYEILISTQFYFPELDIHNQFIRGYIRNSNDSIFYKKDQEPEILLYNYNMQIGDFFGTDEINFIDTVFIFNEPKRRYFWGSNSPTDYLPIFVLEDIGLINYYNNYTWTDHIGLFGTSYFFNSYYDAEQKKLFKINEILPSPFDCHYNDIEKQCEGYTDNCASILSNWYAKPDFTSIFRLETRAIPFSAKIIFANPEHACDLELSISVTNSNDELVHYQSLAVDISDTIQTFIFPETYTPPCTHTDIYNFKYELTNQAEMTIEDEREFQVELTDDFVNTNEDIDKVALSSITSLEEGAIAISSIFYNELNHVSLRQVNLGLADVNQISSGFLHIQVFELADAIGEEILPSERELIGAAIMIIDTLENRTDFNVNLFAVTQSGDPIPGTVPGLKEQTNYLIVLLVEPLSPSGPAFDFYAKPPAQSTCEANTYAHNELSLSNQYGHYTAPMTIGTPSEFESISLQSNCKFQVNTGLVITPFADATFNCMPSLVNNQTTPQIKIYPNPLSIQQMLTIQKEESEIQKISIFNLNGEMVFLNDETQYQGQVRLDFSQLATGVYIMHLETENGIQTEKLIIVN